MDRRDMGFKEYKEYIYKKYGQGVDRRLWDSVKSMDDPIFNQESWRFQGFVSDGETQAFIAALNTGISLSSADSFGVGIRFLVQETGGFAGANTSFQLEARLNSGTPFDVDDVSTICVTIIAPFISDGDDTTQRIGSGTFVTPNAGFDEVNGRAGGNALDFAGSDEVELLYSIELADGDMNNDDLIEVRVKGVDTFTAPEWADITAIVAGAGAEVPLLMSQYQPG